MSSLSRRMPLFRPVTSEIVALADQRLEARADRKGKPLAVREVRDTQPHDHVDRPRVDAPVEEGDRQGPSGGRGRPASAARRAAVVHHRLGDAVEHQADAHSRREQHREPGERADLRALIVASEAEMAVAAAEEPDREPDEERNRHDVEPAEVGGDAVQDRRQQGGRGVGREDAEAEEREQQATGDEEHRRVDGEVRRLGHGGLAATIGQRRPEMKGRGTPAGRRWRQTWFRAAATCRGGTLCPPATRRTECPGSTAD